MPTPLTQRALSAAQLPSGELERLAQVARVAAEAGAAQLRLHFGQLERIREKGRAGDLVTEADVAAEQAVLAVAQFILGAPVQMQEEVVPAEFFQQLVYIYHMV